MCSVVFTGNTWMGWVVGWVLIFDSTGWRVLVVSWLGYGLFFGCDYLRRQEKHINRKVYILLFGEYHVNILVGIVLCLLFFGNCLGYVLLYPLVFLINIVTRCMYLGVCSLYLIPAVIAGC